MEDISDKEILELSYSHPSKFGILFDRYHKLFLATSTKNFLSKGEAEDAVQNTFIRIYKYGHTFLDREGEFKYWAFAILKNCTIDELKKRPRSTPMTEEMENVFGSSEMQEESESNNYMDSILAKMNSAGAEILKLRFVLGKSFKQISKILGINSSAARVRAYRAKKDFIAIHNKLNSYESR